MKYIVEFKKETTSEQRIAIIQESGAKYVGNIFAGFELVVCLNEEVVNLLSSNGHVVSIEPDGYGEKNDAEPADFPTQLINVIGNAHGKGYKGDGVVVAVIDTGLNYNHEDLQFPIYKCARILNSKILSTGNIDDIKDINGHGTAVTAVLAMQENNVGYVGVSPNARFIIIKATDAEEKGLMQYSDMVKSIIWAVDNGANVISISFGNGVFMSSVQAACEYAYSRNVSVIAPAGNEGGDLTFTGGLTPTENVSYWKDYPGVIVVGSVKRKENRNGKLLPELPIAYRHYKYSLIYYSVLSSRYRLLLSDAPITIEKSVESGVVHQLIAKGYNEVYDLTMTNNAMQWTVNSNRKSSDYVINFGSGYLGESGLPVCYTNFDIIDNQKGGIINTPITSMDIYRNHITENFKHLLSDYDEITDIDKAPYSSFGRGVDFAAPGYFNLPIQNTNHDYKTWSGTSFSTPYTAGIIALIRQRFPQLTVDKIYKLLKSNALLIGDGNSNYYGNGLVTVPDLSMTLVTRFYYQGEEIELVNFMVSA